MKYVFKTKIMPTSNSSFMTDSFPTLHPPWEPPPVAKHHEWHFLPVGDFDGLVCLVDGVREPHLSRLLYHLYKHNLRFICLNLKSKPTINKLQNYYIIQCKYACFSNVTVFQIFFVKKVYKSNSLHSSTCIFPTADLNKHKEQSCKEFLWPAMLKNIVDWYI